MSVNSTITNLIKIGFMQSGGTRWIVVEDAYGNQLTMFINSLDQLDILMCAINDAVNSFSMDEELMRH